jgi:hypothetical protein
LGKKEEFDCEEKEWEEEEEEEWNWIVCDCIRMRRHIVFSSCQIT